MNTGREVTSFAARLVSSVSQQITRRTYVILLHPVERKRMMCSPSARPQQATGDYQRRSELLDVPCLQTDLPPSRRASSSRKDRGANEESGEIAGREIDPSGCQTLSPSGSIRKHWFDIAGVRSAYALRLNVKSGALPHPTSY